MLFRLFVPLATLVLAAWACASPQPSTANASPAARSSRDTAAIAGRATFAWPGTYDLVGTGFPEGARVAIMHVTPRDTSYLLSLQGPPGRLHSLRVAGDSAHVVWDLGGDLMSVELRGTGDALDGRWRIGDQSGAVQGVRRR